MCIKKTHYCVVNNLICSHKLNQLVILWIDVANSRVFTTYQQSCCWKCSMAAVYLLVSFIITGRITVEYFKIIAINF